MENIAEKIKLSEETRKRMDTRRKALLAALGALEKPEEPEIVLPSSEKNPWEELQDFVGKTGSGKAAGSTGGIKESTSSVEGVVSVVEKDKKINVEDILGALENLTNERIDLAKTYDFADGMKPKKIMDGFKIKEEDLDFSGLSESERNEAIARANGVIYSALQGKYEQYMEKADENTAEETVQSGEKSDDLKTENTSEDGAVVGEELSPEEQAKFDKLGIENGKKEAELVDGEVEFTWVGEEPKDVPGKGEVKSENMEPKDPLLENLENARKEFVKMEFENRSKWVSVKRFFGFKDDRESEDVKNERERYEKALDDYRKAKISELRIKSETGEDVDKEMSDLLMMFRYKEVLDLVDSRTQAKLDSFKDTLWGTLRSIPTKIAQAYNEIPLGVKLGIAGAAFISGSVAFIAGRRILGGIVTGVGLSKGYEALDQKIMQRRASRDTEVDLEKIKVTEGDRFEELNSILDRYLSGENGVAERMQNALTRRNRGKAVAVAAGGTMAALGLGKFAESIFGEAANNTYLPNTNSGDGLRLETPVTDSFIHPPATPSPFEVSVPDEGPLAAGADSGIPIGGVNHLEVPERSGKGIENVLIDELEKRGVENPGNVAHRIVLEYAKNNDLTLDKLNHIKSASFEIEPGGREGFQIKDLKFDALKGNVGPIGDAGHVEPTATYTETHTPLGQPGADGAMDQEAVEKAFQQEANTGNPYSAQVEDVRGKMNTTTEELKTAASRHVAPPSGSFLHDEDFGPKQVTDLHGPDADRVAELAAQKEAYANALEQLGAKGESFQEIGKSAIKGISGNKVELWRQMKDISYNEAIKKPEMRFRILQTFGKFRNLLGEEALKPLNGGNEKMSMMVARLTKAIVEKGK